MYRLTEEQVLLRNTVERIVKDKVLPEAAKIDETDEFPWDIIRMFHEQGYLTMLLPEEYGGGGETITNWCIILEEIAKASLTCGLTCFTSGGVQLPIIVGGSREVKAHYFPLFCKEFKILALSQTEPGAGSDVAGIRTRAVFDGKDYIINGRKSLITNGDIADFYLTIAVTDHTKTQKGMSAFIVEKGTPGLSFGSREEKMGMRGSPTTDVIYEDVRVPQQNLVGKEDEGFIVMMEAFDRMRPGIAALAIGIAQGAFKYSVKYSKERHAFHKTLSEFQGIQFMLANMATLIEAARSLLFKTTSMLDDDEENAGKYSSMSKLFASDVAMKVTTDAVQILGGYGYLRAHPVERMMRDAKLTQIFEGANQIQQIIIARSILSKV